MSEETKVTVQETKTEEQKLPSKEEVKKETKKTPYYISQKEVAARIRELESKLAETNKKLEEALSKQTTSADAALIEALKKDSESLKKEIAEIQRKQEAAELFDMRVSADETETKEKSDTGTKALLAIGAVVAAAVVLFIFVIEPYLRKKGIIKRPIVISVPSPSSNE